VVGSDFSRRLPPRRQATHQQQSLNYENFLRSDAIDGPEQSEESPPPVKRPPKRVRRTAAKVPVENPDHNQLFTDDEFSDVLRTIRRHGTVEQFLRSITTSPTRGRGSLNDLRKVLLSNDCVIWGEEFTTAVMDKVGWRFMKGKMKSELKQFGETFIGKFDVLKRQENESELVEDTILERLAKYDNQQALVATAPILTDLLSDLVEPDRAKEDWNARWVQIAFNISHLAKLYKPQTFIGLAEVLTLQMHHCNLTRRGIETLQAIGVCMGYTTLNNRLHKITEHHKGTVVAQGQDLRRVVGYDNFNASFNVRQALFGDENQFCNVTTGLVKIGKHIPSGGLRQVWFHPNYNLTTADVIPVTGRAMEEHFQLHDKVRPTIKRYNVSIF
jgi:hypothetical protein